MAIFAAVLGFCMVLPSLASAGLAEDLLGNLGLEGGGSGVNPTAGTPSGSGYVPPLHGTNPHGQGTVGVVDLAPENENPYGGDPSGSDSGEEVVIGRSRGEQNGSSYHGHVTVLAVFGTELVGTDSNEGQSNTGPLEPVQEAVLDNLCTGTGNAVCLEVLRADSATTGTGSKNSFAVEEATVDVGALLAFLGLPAPPTPISISSTTAESNGNINESGGCQTADGDSTVASANVVGLTADALNSSYQSQACNGGSQNTQNDSEVLNLVGAGIPVPATGCADGTPNTEFTVLTPVAETVCNALDANGDQAPDPQGVIEALTAFAVVTGDGAVAKTTTAASEARAVPPGTAAGGPGGGGPGAGGGPGDDGDDDGGAGGGSAAGEATSPRADRLAFTGQDVALLALLGLGLVAAGAGVTILARRPTG